MIIINRNKLRCPTCGSQMEPAIAVNDIPSKFWVKCTSPTCNTYVDTYVPLPHQERIHKDIHRFLGIFGGYGSGKTQCTIKDDEKHMLTTPLGTTVVGSAVLSQVEQTWEKDWANDFPKAFIKKQNKQKKEYQLINGHNVLIKSYYDEELLRSLNASRIHIVEASAVDLEIYTQLMTRLRNDAGTLRSYDANGTPLYDYKNDSFILEADWRRGLIESNPSAGWIRDSFLLQSSSIDLNGSDYKYSVVANPNPEYSSYVIPTKANVYLPPTFYEDNARNKPKWWVARFLNGSFDYAEGLVYPQAYASLMKSFEVPKEWVRLVGMDYGIRDATAFIFLAVDQQNEQIYVIGEIYLTDTKISDIAKCYHKVEFDNYSINPYRLPVMDGRSINKRNDLDHRTIGDLFADQGVWFEPAQMDLDARITQVNELFESYKLKIFEDKCPNLKREIMAYKFPERASDDTMKKGGDKPIDKNNHAVNALEFACMELPKDLKELKLNAYDANGNVLKLNNQRKAKLSTNPYGVYALEDTRRKDDYNMSDVFIGTGGSNDIPW